MAELKTLPNDGDVKKFIAGLADEPTRRDCEALMRMMRAASGSPPRMWGAGIVGFGSYRYVYASGHEGEWPLVAFSPRKRSLSIYIMPGFGRYGALMKKLGPHKTGKSCLYARTLDDLHLPTLKTLVERSVRDMKKIAALRRNASKKS
jgi:hypothetical protein